MILYSTENGRERSVARNPFASDSLYQVSDGVAGDGMVHDSLRRWLRKQGRKIDKEYLPCASM